MSTDYGSYTFRGFWFQPDPVSMDEADPTRHNAFLNKYWDSDSYSENLPQSESIFSNYFNYGQDIDTSNTSSYFDSYFNLGQNIDTSGTSSYFDGYFNLGQSSSSDSIYDSMLSDIKNLSKGSTSDMKRLESLYDEVVDCVGNLIANSILENLGVDTKNLGSSSGSSSSSGTGSYFSSYFNLGQNLNTSSGSSSYFDAYFNLGQNIDTSDTSSYFDSYFNLDF